MIEKNLNIKLSFIETVSLREYHSGELTNYTIDEYSEKYPKVIEEYFKSYKLPNSEIWFSYQDIPRHGYNIVF